MGVGAIPGSAATPDTDLPCQAPAAAKPRVGMGSGGETAPPQPVEPGAYCIHLAVIRAAAKAENAVSEYEDGMIDFDRSEQSQVTPDQLDRLSRARENALAAADDNLATLQLATEIVTRKHNIAMMYASGEQVAAIDLEFHRTLEFLNGGATTNRIVAENLREIAAGDMPGRSERASKTTLESAKAAEVKVITLQRKLEDLVKSRKEANVKLDAINAQMDAYRARLAQEISAGTTTHSSEMVLPLLELASSRYDAGAALKDINARIRQVDAQLRRELSANRAEWVAAHQNAANSGGGMQLQSIAAGLKRAENMLCDWPAAAAARESGR
jgi:hypothetical protein